MAQNNGAQAQAETGRALTETTTINNINNLPANLETAMSGPVVNAEINQSPLNVSTAAESEKPMQLESRSPNRRSKETAENNELIASAEAEAKEDVDNKENLGPVTFPQSENEIPCPNSNNNNNDEKDNNIVEANALSLNMEMLQMVPSKSGYNKEDLKHFLTGSTIEEFNVEAYSTEQLFVRFIDEVHQMFNALTVEIIDLFHLAIFMQSYKPLDLDCTTHRFELLEGIIQMSSHFPGDMYDFMGTCLCDKLVYGGGLERTERVAKMQLALSHIIIQGGVNRRIAKSALLATFKKVSGKQPPDSSCDIITQTFEMVKLVDWIHLSSTNNVADIFILLRTLAMIMHTAANWDAALGTEISEFFSKLLEQMSVTQNSGSFAVMVEHYFMSNVIFNIKKPYFPRLH